jgi:hypothetical protein
MVATFAATLVALALGPSGPGAAAQPSLSVGLSGALQQLELRVAPLGKWQLPSQGALPVPFSADGGHDCPVAAARGGQCDGGSRPCLVTTTTCAAGGQVIAALGQSQPRMSQTRDYDP